MYGERMNLAAIPTFAGQDVFHVVVGAPRGSMLKLKYEPRWEAMSISRPLPLGLVFRSHRRFVPSMKGSGAAAALEIVRGAAVS